jgi:serine/threonine protein kinase
MKELNIDNYTFGRVLGLGSYAIVRQGIHKTNGAKVAIKTYEKKNLQDPMKLKNV